MKCNYQNLNGAKCQRDADESGYCPQHFKLIYGNEPIDPDLTYSNDQFIFVHYTTFDNLAGILDSGFIKRDVSSTDRKIFLSVIFPGDKQGPFESCKSRYVCLFLSPQIFQYCGEVLAESDPEICHYTPSWQNLGKKGPRSVTYNKNLNLNDNLNKIFNMQLNAPETQVKEGLGTRYENEIVISNDISLDRFLEGIYIPRDFKPEYEEDFDLEEFKAQYPQYHFIDSKNVEDLKYYRNLINFRAFDKYTEE